MLAIFSILDCETFNGCNQAWWETLRDSFSTARIVRATMPISWDPATICGAPFAIPTTQPTATTRLDFRVLNRSPKLDDGFSTSRTVHWLSIRRPVRRDALPWV